MTSSPISRGRLCAIFMAAATIAPSALTADAAAFQGSAHEHGVAELSFAVEDGQVQAELHTPLANLVGFEHEPRTEAQKSAYENALAALRQDDLFTFEGARCALSDVTLDTPGYESPHAGDEHGDHEHHGGHAEIVARYVFACDKADRIRSAGTRLFDRFEGFQEITVIFLGASTSVGELTPARPVLEVE
ncbi:ZrgA family zinc uptake protein [Euryhalocaulis caribicus]|uniref:ZrgA family zinc uptake protein n=1 Tax=Euryhalocaulis caribicus TaxID=1161401 RepID=UPI0009DC063A|nr:DUF2796 domain-containing protein [Euryhalocaulis caribicus]